MKAMTLWALRALAQWPGALALLLLCTVFQVVYLVGAPLIWKVIFDDAILGKDLGVLGGAIGGLFALLVIFALANLGREWMAARLAVRAVNGLRETLFGHAQRLPLRHLSEARAGVVSDRLLSDLPAVETALVRGLPPLLTQGSSAGVSVLLLFLIDWRLALVTLACMPLIFLASKPFASAAARANDQLRAESEDLVQLVNETSAAHLVVRLFRMREGRLALLRETLDHLSPLASRAHFLAGVVGRSAHVATGFMEMVVIGFGGYLVVAGYMTPGLVVAFVGLMFNIGNAIGQLNTAIPLLIQGGAGYRRVSDLLAVPPEDVENPGAGPLPKPRGAITVEGVTHSHDGQRPALKGVDLTIPVGTRVAFVGPSGSGKSTLQTLMTRLVRPDEGRLCIDGQDLRDLSEDSLRARMGVVLQSPILFDATVRENLLLAKPDASEAEIEAATRAASVHDDILGLTHGYDTRVGAGGGALSGGQRQRLSIARALLRDPDILLLDEATSALDPGSEERVNAALADWVGADRTLVVVSHRLKAVRDFDRIFVFQEGRLVEEGDHASLLARNGLYADLWHGRRGEEA